MPVVLNARAAVRPRLSGVERWASEVIARLCELDPERYVVLAPRARLRDSRVGGQLWEQAVLPFHAARLGASLVFSPANLGPWLWRRSVLVMHDAAPLREPEAYSRIYGVLHARLGVGVARRAIAVITVSDFSRGELVELLGIDPARIVVVGGAAGPQFGPGLGAQAEAVAARYGLGAPYVLTVATEDRRKNLAVLEKAAELLQDHGIELVWAGAPRSYIASAPAVPGIRAIGYVDDADLPGLYAGAAAFVLPSLYEGFGLPCIEAMACGTPVVASDRGGLPEACGGAALLVDPLDGEAVAAAVLRAATDEDLRRQLTEAGLRRASELSWDRVAASVDALLTRLVFESRLGR